MQLYTVEEVGVVILFIHVFTDAHSSESPHATPALFSVRLRNHANDNSLPPILIYPEGVCVNNTSVMQFKKGSFEVGYLSVSPMPLPCLGSEEAV